MKTSLVYASLALALVAVLTDGKRGICEVYDYTAVFHSCQGNFVVQLRNSESPFEVCQTLYEDASKCFIDNAIEPCYNNSGRTVEEYTEIETSELAKFGSGSLYCENGGIRSIKPLIKDAIDREIKCKEEMTLERVEACESPFYTTFQNNPADASLCRIYTNTTRCQLLLLSQCGLAFSAFGPNNEPPNTEYSGNMFCWKKQKDFTKKTINVIITEGSHHATSWDVMAPIIVICVLILIALVVGFCYLASRESSSKPADEQTKTSEKESDQQQETDQPVHGGEEMIPLSTVVTNENEGISSA